MANTMDSGLNQLLEKLKAAFGDRLSSVVLYGSSAGDGHSDPFSDRNVLCVLTAITARELEDAEPVFRWWMGKKNPSPLLLAQNELTPSAACFPIEFRDLRDRRKVLHGSDPIDSLPLDESFHRAQVARELRTKLIRLRQKAAGLISDQQGLLGLMADSVSTFCVLGRHALLAIGGEAPFDRRALAVELQSRFGVKPDPMIALLDLREGRVKPKQMNPVLLLGGYLSELEKLVRAVEDSPSPVTEI